jgi:hypothetical protein
MIKYGIAALGLGLLASFAHADGDYASPTNDRIRVSLGAMRTSNSTTLQIDSSSGIPGTVINGESQFGLDASDIEPKFQAMVRAGERNRIFFDYFTLDRTGNAIVSQPIVFRDAVLQPGDPLQSVLNLRLFTITYGYSFWHTEKLEIAATLGITAVDVSAQAKVQTAASHINQLETAAGPYPTPGVSLTWVASKRFYLDGRVQYLGVHVNHFDGSLGFYELDALYRFRPNVSFALGYNYVKADLSSTETGNSGLFNISAKGPEIFVRVAF